MADPVPYLTTEEIRARVGNGAGSLPPDTTEGNALVADWVTEFEEIAEDYRGVAFTPRTTTLTATVESCTRTLFLRPLVRSVASLTVAGTLAAPTSYDVYADTGIVEYSVGFTTGQSIVVVYEHGMAAPPMRAKRACLEYVKAIGGADKSSTSRNVIAQSFDGGTTRYSTPDKAAGRPTGFLEVDRLLNSLPDYRTPGIG